MVPLRSGLVCLGLATLMSGAATAAFAADLAARGADKAPVILFEDARTVGSAGMGTVRTEGGNRYGPRSAPANGTASVTYFTPRVSGVGALARWSSMAPSSDSADAAAGNIALGLAYDEVLGSVSIRADMAGTVARNEAAAGLAEAAETYGPRTDAAGRDWKIGAALGYANMELGASFSDGGGNRCGLWGSCAGGTWDVGLAYRFDAGSVAAGYTATGGEIALDGRSIYSLNADYSVAPRMDLYGGVNWVDIDTSAKDTSSGAVFLLGTNVRF
ncbi:MAG: hypothetical protein AB7G39_03035 [Alphaproteobacteria bacterium]